MVPPWVTASHFLVGNREAELKLSTFSSLLLFCDFLSFLFSLPPQWYSTFECCLLGLLLNIYIPYQTTTGSAPTMPRKKTRRKEQRKKGSGQRAKPSTPIQATDARMGEEEQNRQQKEEQRKETGSHLDHSVTFYNPHRSYSEPIQKSYAHKDIYIFIY